MTVCRAANYSNLMGICVRKTAMFAASWAFVCGWGMCSWATQELAQRITAPEKSVRHSSGEDRQLTETFDRAQDFLSAGRVHEAAEQFALVAKLAEEPLRSHAMLKFGYAASILGNSKSRGALTAALHTPVPDPEGLGIKTFARKILESTEPAELLTAPPKENSKFFPFRLSRSAAPSADVSDAGRSKSPVSPAGIWDQINEIETYRGKGRVSMAIRRYRELLAAYPDHPVLLNNLSLILADGLDPHEAESLIRRAFLAPGAEKYVEYLYDTLGVAKLGQGRPAESIDHFRHALSMRETAARNLHMALALESIGQPDAAEQYRNRALALDTTGELSAAP